LSLEPSTLTVPRFVPSTALWWIHQSPPLGKVWSYFFDGKSNHQLIFVGYFMEGRNGHVPVIFLLLVTSSVC
jgi:hypothetical protein